MTEKEAKDRFPDLVIASLGAQRKEKPGGKVSARVLFDGTHGLCVNTRTRLRDQERAPIAADLKRSMREKAKVDEPLWSHVNLMAHACSGRPSTGVRGPWISCWSSSLLCALCRGWRSVIVAQDLRLATLSSGSASRSC